MLLRPSPSLLLEVSVREFTLELKLLPMTDTERKRAALYALAGDKKGLYQLRAARRLKSWQARAAYAAVAINRQLSYLEEHESDPRRIVKQCLYCTPENVVQLVREAMNKRATRRRRRMKREAEWHNGVSEREAGHVVRRAMDIVIWRTIRRAELRAIKNIHHDVHWGTPGIWVLSGGYGRRQVRYALATNERFFEARRAGLGYRGSHKGVLYLSPELRVLQGRGNLLRAERLVVGVWTPEPITYGRSL